MPHLARKLIIDASDCLPRQASEILEDLGALQELLGKWQRVQNLVSKDTLAQFWDRHVADSLQILPYLPGGEITLLDLGSGGGFPALPLAICLKGSAARLILVESNARKVAFLRAVTRQLGLPVTVINKRIDKIVSRETGSVSVITARALAPLPMLCELAWPFWSEQTKALVHKGREHVVEITDSGAEWDFDVVLHSSVVDRAGVIVELTNLRPKSR